MHPRTLLEPHDVSSPWVRAVASRFQHQDEPDQCLTPKKFYARVDCLAAANCRLAGAYAPLDCLRSAAVDLVWLDDRCIGHSSIQCSVLSTAMPLQQFPLGFELLRPSPHHQTLKAPVALGYHQLETVTFLCRSMEIKKKYILNILVDLNFQKHNVVVNVTLRESS